MFTPYTLARFFFSVNKLRKNFNPSGGILGCMFGYITAWQNPDSANLQEDTSRD